MSVADISQVSRHTAVQISSYTSVGSSSFGEAEMTKEGMAHLRNMGSTLGSTLWRESSTPDGNDVTVAIDKDDNIAFIISWGTTARANPGAHTPTVNVAVGDRWRNKLEEFNLTPLAGVVTATSSTVAHMRRWLVGPFETARFAKNATSTSIAETKLGAHYITFTLTTLVSSHSTENDGLFHVVPFRMPRVTY